MRGPKRWPAIRALLAGRGRVALAGAQCVSLLCVWLAWRTGWPALALFVTGLLAAEHLAGEGRA